MKVGILFGGQSREREISFAGGRTVYDMLDKSRYTPVPLFVDSLGHLVLLDWQYLYKGTIRDFFPPAALCPPTPFPFQYYAEQLYPGHATQWDSFLRAVGRPVALEELPALIDFAFLALHGLHGEDGSLQGVLEWLGIPYSGAGIYGSAVGMDKLLQKQLMHSAGFATPGYEVLHLADGPQAWQQAAERLGYPCVVKHPTQGSSIGVRVVHTATQLAEAVWACSFRQQLQPAEWQAKTQEEKVAWINQLADIRHGLGLPLYVNDTLIHLPQDLLATLDGLTAPATLRATDSTDTLLLEQFIAGREFSVIVVEQPDGSPLALPPTEIVKGHEVFDYRSKYLPGMSRKLTPMQLPDDALRALCRQAEALKEALNIAVYARLDGLLAPDGTVYFNDPNTTSGMLPSSFFFHQAAEVGLNPSRFLSYLIQRSLACRSSHPRLRHTTLAQRTDSSTQAPRLRVGVILGGYSTERHISVESGRNIYEKLSASTQYQPVPIFVLDHHRLPAGLTTPPAADAEGRFSLWQIPVNILLKDNADDIADKIIAHLQGHKANALMEEIRAAAAPILAAVGAQPLEAPRLLPQTEWPQAMDFAFIALHGRPGEDGTLQALLEQVRVPYNGSPVHSSQITIDKYETTERLMAAGMHAAHHHLAYKQLWLQDREQFLAEIEKAVPYPMIAKPHDEGCSSAVKRLRTRQQLEAYAALTFRDNEVYTPEQAATMGLKAKEEFPAKDTFLAESLIHATGDELFMEVTVGLLTHHEPGGIRYEVFEPSETLATGEVLSLEEKFLAGEGQNITPARFSPQPQRQQQISEAVKDEIGRAARLLGVEGYCRIDAFVRVAPQGLPVVEFIEVNSLPGMTPATCIFHQCALAGYRPIDFISRIIQYGIERQKAGQTA